jgi:hypothetical protein
MPSICPIGGTMEVAFDVNRCVIKIESQSAAIMEYDSADVVFVGPVADLDPIDPVAFALSKEDANVVGAACCCRKALKRVIIVGPTIAFRPEHFGGQPSLGRPRPGRATGERDHRASEGGYDRPPISRNVPRC